MGKRIPEYEINPMILNRTSKRAMSGEGISDQELFSLFEAAKWAPSSRNEQPWRFIYAKKEHPEFESFFNLLVEGNKVWCKNASALIVLISQKNFNKNNRPNKNHSFDSGAAWQNLALEGTSKGLVVHAMAGFDSNKAKQDLGIPDDYSVEVMIAVGKPGNIIDLTLDLQEREAPSQRKPLKETVMKGNLINSFH